MIFWILVQEKQAKQCVWKLNYAFFLIVLITEDASSSILIETSDQCTHSLNLACSLYLLYDMSILLTMFSYILFRSACIPQYYQAYSWIIDWPAANSLWNTSATIKIEQKYVAVFFEAMLDDYAWKYYIIHVLHKVIIYKGLSACLVHPRHIWCSESALERFVLSFTWLIYLAQFSLSMK